MAQYVVSGSRLTLRVRVGTKPSGMAEMKSLSWAGIDAAASADAVKSAGDALAALVAFPLVETRKTDVDLVTA